MQVRLNNVPNKFEHGFLCEFLKFGSIDKVNPPGPVLDVIFNVKIV